MTSLGDLKIPLYPQVNGVPRAPTTSRAANATWLLQRINQILDQLIADFDSIELEVTGADPTEVTALRNRITGVEQAFDTLNARITALQTENQAQGQTLGILETARVAVSEAINTLQSEIQALRKIEQSFFGNDLPNYAAGSGSFELGIRVRFMRAGNITGIRYFKPHTETGSHTGRIWNETGTLLTSVSFLSETNSNWQTQKLEPSFLVQPDTDYLISVGSNSITPYGSTPFEDRSNNDLIAISAAYGEIATFPVTFLPGANYLRDLEFVPTG